MKQINLVFNKSISSLCGNPYGQQVYNEQVSCLFDENDQIEVCIPDYIDSVSMSFAQGFYSSLAEKYGLENVGKYIKIKSSHERVNQKFASAITIRNLL